VQAMDFSHRVQIEKRDQLGELGESFNKMTGSIANLVEEENKRRRLEDEISIAREVQTSFFPSTLPSVPGVEIEAICKAARSVSVTTMISFSSANAYRHRHRGYLWKGNFGGAADGKPASGAAQQMLSEGSERLSMVELVSRLNKHLVRNTGDDRFATFFIAIYDSASGRCAIRMRATAGFSDLQW